MIVFSQVTPWVEGFLSNLRGKGLCGNIVQDHPSQLRGDENATWTGERFQLAFVGSPAEYLLELREFSNASPGHYQVIRTEKDSEKFHELVIDVAVREG